MCRRTSSFTELGTCANEDAFDKYDTASANAGEGEYGAVIIPTVGSKGLTYFKPNILYYVTNKGYHPVFKRVQQLAPPEKPHGHGSERVGYIVRNTHLEHLRPDRCRAVGHNDPGLLEGSDLVGSSTWEKYIEPHCDGEFQMKNHLFHLK